MATPGGYSYKPNVSRAVTKKWREANQINYEGDDWGDEDDAYDDPATVSAGGTREVGRPPQGPIYPSNRSVTNPSPSRGGGKPSFDRGDERRYFSAGGFESAYPTTQRPPFPEQQHDLGAPPAPAYRDPPPLHINTQGPGVFSPSGQRPTSRGRQHSSTEAPFSAPGGYPNRPSHSSNRPAQGEIFQRRESPRRPDSRSSNASARQFPPRKSSHSQQQPLIDVSRLTNDPPRASNTPSSDSTDAKPLPFIRPADIYKRMEEEREKERRSQESSRPSFDTATSKIRESSTGAHSHSSASEPRDGSNAAPPPQQTVEDAESSRRLKPTLDTVAERKSEYGFDNLLQNADSPRDPGAEKAAQAGQGVVRQPTTASSVYTDRPDPVSASSVSRNPSLWQGSVEPSSPQSPFGLPSIDRVSSFGIDVADVGDPAGAASRDHLSAPVQQPPSVPPKGEVGTSQKDAETGPKALQHQPSLGYTSLVHQAFDESQKQTALSPTSASETILRSNSASTSDISPIMSRNPAVGDNPSVAAPAEPPISEEPTIETSGPTSSPTLKGENLSSSGPPLPPPPAIQSGYRRDRTPPSRDNSPARRPLSVQTLIDPQPQQATLTAEGPRVPAKDAPLADKELQLRGRSPTSTTMAQRQYPVATTSQKGEEWPAQPKQFSSKLGIQESSLAASPRPSPISRSETPAKGLVDANAAQYDANTPRPAPQAGFDGSGSSTPGGWHSASPGVETPSQLSHASLPSQSRVDSAGGIPTAQLPTSPVPAQSEGPAHTAFAATANQRTPEESQESSENEWDTSSTSSRQEPAIAETRDFSSAHDSQRGQILLPMTFSDRAPSAESDGHGLRGAQSPRDTSGEGNVPPSTVDYFPAPLRTNRVTDRNVIAPGQVPNVLASDVSPAENDHDRLQQEIVKSLTPKSSRVDGEADEAIAPTVTVTGAGGVTESSGDVYNKGEVSGPSQERPTQDLESVEEDSTPIESREPVYPTRAQEPATPRQHFLQKRFSWETGSDQAPSATTPKQMTPTAADSPETIRAPASPPPNDTNGQPLDSTVASDSTAPSVDRTGVPPPVSKIETGHPPPSTAVRNTPATGAAFRSIMGLNSPQERIKAFDENRHIYAMSDGQLEGWLMSMRSPEHSDVFTMNGRTSLEKSERVTPNRPSPRRLIPESTPARHMQEDGKRLMAAAGRFGGKAGIAAKGLFAKGKDKLRTASSGEKASSSNRRQSTGPSLAEPEEFQPQPRSSTFLATPPQLPLNFSPIDMSQWSLPFASGDAQRLPTKFQSEQAENGDRQLATDHDLQQSTLGPSKVEPGNADASTSLGVTPSVIVATPTISTLGSETHENAEFPSRTMSQVTRASAEHWPVDVPDLGGPAQDVKESSTDLSIPKAEQELSTVSSSGGLSKPLTAVVSPASIVVENVEDDALGAVSKSPDLAVSEDRRRSFVSDVSSASPGLGAASGAAELRRSVSPAEVQPGREDSATETYLKERVTLDNQTVNDEYPGHSTPEARIATDRTRETSQEEHDEDVPLPAAQQGNEKPTVPAGPFSLQGKDDVKDAHQPQWQEPLTETQRKPSQTLSPVSLTVSKELSEVSIDEVKDQQDHPSISGPFRGDPDRRDYSKSEQVIDVSQRYSNTSALPSSRRPQEDLNRYRGLQQQRQQAPKVEESDEEEYRIPGPYGQEYRSPKRISLLRNGRSPVLQDPPRRQQFHSIQEPWSDAMSFLASAVPGAQQAPAQQQTVVAPQEPFDQRLAHAQETPNVGPSPGPSAPGSSSYYPPQEPISAEQQPKTETRPPTESHRSKQRIFGGLFRNRSRSRSRKLKESERGTKEKRASMFRANSRHDSLSSQHSGLQESRDEGGHLAGSNAGLSAARRLSKDILRSSTPEPKDQREGKKKRFSGIGNLFKSSRQEGPTQPVRASTMPVASTASPYMMPPGRDSQAHSFRNSATMPFQQPYPPAQYSYGHLQGMPPPAAGYYGPQNAYPHYLPAGYPQGPDFVSRDFPQRPTQDYEGRPADLRIDTGPHSRNPYNMPATAPAQTYPGQANQYPPRLDVLPTPALAWPPAGLKVSQPSPSTRVGTLHLRSRSPKLGRRSSSEERHQGQSRLDDPASSLGTFSSKKISPVGGVPRPEEDQEAPFRIVIPGDEETRKERNAKQTMIEHAENTPNASMSAMGSGATAAAAPATTGIPHTGGETLFPSHDPVSRSPSPSSLRPVQGENTNTSVDRRGGATGAVYELPGSKAEGYESEEDIPMSATAYPGQEWVPVMEGGWDD